MSKYIIGLDIGYGDVKVVVGEANGTISHNFKFSSAIAAAQKLSVIRDSRVIDLSMVDNQIVSVYVGQDALSLASQDIIDIVEYESLEAYAPAFVYQALKMAKIEPEEVLAIVSGLSVAQLAKSGYFRDRIQQFTINEKQYKFDQVFILPQGAGSKMTFDKYGSNFPELRTESTKMTYVGGDIGFNTLDLFLVTDGKTSPNFFKGLAGEGVMRIAQIVREKILELHNREITLREAKQVLDERVYKLRGERHDMAAVVDSAIEAYKNRLFELIETNFGNVMDKSDFVALFGGGAVFCKSKADKFFHVVENSPEFYNAIGFYLYGCNNVKSQS